MDIQELFNIYGISLSPPKSSPLEGVNKQVNGESAEEMVTQVAPLGGFNVRQMFSQVTAGVMEKVVVPLSQIPPPKLKEEMSRY